MDSHEAMGNRSVRLSHFSDIHLTAKPLGWQLRDIFTKRTTGWLNLKLGRGRRFVHSKQIVRALIQDIKDRRTDHIVFTGDATMMGFEEEFHVAAENLNVDRGDWPAGIAVPGNHDYYTPSAERSSCFETVFAPWQLGKRLGSKVYPFVQRAGHCWLIAVNSARSNFLLWDARGGVDTEQCERLRALCKDLEPGPRILVTHYPIYLANREPEHRWRILRNWKGFLSIAAECGVSLLLHGHRHIAYELPADGKDLPFPILCPGSATQRNNCSYNEYLISDRHLSVTRRTWLPDQRCFQTSKESDFDLP